MAVADNTYSRVVGWLKILLPLGALALLSTLFLFARGIAPVGEIPYAELEEIAREARISDPRLCRCRPGRLGDRDHLSSRITREPDQPEGKDAAAQAMTLPLRSPIPPGRR